MRSHHGGDKELIGRIVDRVKDMESRGFTFEAADASFELLVHEEMSGKRPSFFTINHWVTSALHALSLLSAVSFAHVLPMFCPGIRFR